MKVLIFGDIFGRTGRRMVEENIVALRAKYSPDFMIANSENITGGKGPTTKHILSMQKLGFDVLTGGNHVFSNLKESIDSFSDPSSIQIRPANFYDNPFYEIPGKGWRIVEKSGYRILVINIMSSVFMRDHLDNPFLSVDRILKELQSEVFDGVFVDFHRETTSEMYSMAYFLDGRATVVYGTHTHVQTNDEQIFPKGTGMITDIGMSGPLESSIGHTFESRLPQFLTGTNLFWPKPEQAVGRGLLSWLYVEIDDKKCVHIEKIRIREGEGIS